MLRSKSWIGHRALAITLPLILIGATACQTKTIPTSAIDARAMCAVVKVVKYSRTDTVETRRQIIANNAALGVVCAPDGNK